MRTQACDCRNWSCGLPACRSCNEDHGWCPGELCRDCYLESIMRDIEEHERENPGALAERIDEVAAMLSGKPRRS